MSVPIEQLLGGKREEIARLSWAEYRESPGLNPSTIKAGRDSMLHLKHAWDYGMNDTPSMMWGRAMHCLLFEPREFENRYASWQGRRQGNAYKEFVTTAWEAGKEILPATGRFSMEYALEAAQRFVDEPLVQDLIAAGEAELALFAVEGGIQCRGRVDWVRSIEPEKLVDMKTTRSIKHSFGRDFYRLGYDIQLGLYRRWLRRLTGRDWPVEVIVLENDRPFDLAVIPVDPAVLDRGERRGIEIVRQVEHSIKTGEWPGVAGGEVYFLDTPTWEMDDELEGVTEVEDAA